MGRRALCLHRYDPQQRRKGRAARSYPRIWPGYVPHELMSFARERANYYFWAGVSTRSVPEANFGKNELDNDHLF